MYGFWWRVLVVVGAVMILTALIGAAVLASGWNAAAEVR